jgi:hypothetical protein
MATTRFAVHAPSEDELQAAVGHGTDHLARELGRRLAIETVSFHRTPCVCFFARHFILTLTTSQIIRQKETAQDGPTLLLPQTRVAR